MKLGGKLSRGIWDALGKEIRIQSMKNILNVKEIA